MNTSNGQSPLLATAIPAHSNRQTGRIKWFDPKKGYGFIEKPPGADKDIFVHLNQLPEGTDTLETGQLVTFLTEGSKKGVRAIKVEVNK